jgi:hypothetical protein
MSLDPVIRGTPNDVIWGTNNVYNTARVIRGTKNEQTEKDLSLDNNGAPTGSVTIPTLTEYEVEFEVLASTNLPNLGELVTLMGVNNCVVEALNQLWERKGRKRCTMKAHSFPS